MSTNGSAVRVAWEDRPRRNFDADVTSVKLDQRDTFVLTRVDGMATVADLCAMTGFGDEETVEVVQRLGLLLVDQAEGVRSLVDERTSDGRRRVARRRPSAPERPEAPPFTGVEPEDAAWLARFGYLGHVPGEPFAPPGTGRYGRYEFDRRELLQRCELTIEQRREILFLTHNAERLDHFEFFGLEPTDDRRQLKKAYFVFSKRFHPDSHFRRDTGVFREKIASIYKRGTDIYEALSDREDLRTTYCRAVEARNATYRGRLEDERSARREVTRERELEAAARRKVELQQRLERNKQIRRDRGASNPIAQKVARAEEFYKAGMEQYSSERFLEAANSLQLAMTYDPKNEQYAAAYTRVAEKARQIRAEQYWKRGYMDESVARVREALQSYLEAVEILPRGEWCAHTAALLIDHTDEEHRAVELAEKASRSDPQNLDYLLLLGRVYTQANLIRKAQATYERVLQIDSKHELAKKAVKALKRM